MSQRGQRLVLADRVARWATFAGAFYLAVRIGTGFILHGGGTTP